jgi:hypothetical protein
MSVALNSSPERKESKTEDSFDRTKPPSLRGSALFIRPLQGRVTGHYLWVIDEALTIFTEPQSPEQIEKKGVLALKSFIRGVLTA